MFIFYIVSNIKSYFEQILPLSMNNPEMINAPEGLNIVIVNVYLSIYFEEDKEILL